MTFTTLIAVNAALDLAVVIAIFAIVHFTHKLREPAANPETILPSQTTPARLTLLAEKAEKLAEAAPLTAPGAGPPPLPGPALGYAGG